MVYHRSSDVSSSSSRKDAKPKNCFRNDGSFLEMFKKMQKTSTVSSSSDSPTPNSSSDCSSVSTTTQPLPSTKPESSSDHTSISKTKKSDSEKLQADCEGKTTLNSKLPIFGKRRGGKALPTGQVKKVKSEQKPDVVEEPKDAWSQYLAEVKKYRESTCEEEGKIRPLVK